MARSKCCEVLFNPSLVGKTCMSIPEAIYASVYASIEPARRSVFFENIILAGGCANLKGTIYLYYSNTCTTLILVLLIFTNNNLILINLLVLILMNRIVKSNRKTSKITNFLLRNRQ